MLTTIRGIYHDGVITPLENFDIKDNANVLITILDNKENNGTQNKVDRVEGILSKYANDQLIDKEKDAWQAHVKEKYGHS